VAFFGVMYYAGLRPEEAVSLHKDNLRLPPDTPILTAGVSWNSRTHHPTPVVNGPMTVTTANAASSSTAQAATAAPFRPIPN
jgi:hypothetical protein